MFCWKKGRKTIKKKFFLVLAPTSQDKWDWSDRETHLSSSEFSDTEIAVVTIRRSVRYQAPAPLVLTLAAANFLLVLAEKIIFIKWLSGSSGSVNPSLAITSSSQPKPHQATGRDRDQAGAPHCLTGPDWPGWVSHSTKLNEKIEGFAELDKWSSELALRFSMFYKYFPAWNIF